MQCMNAWVKVHTCVYSAYQAFTLGRRLHRRTHPSNGVLSDNSVYVMAILSWFLVSKEYKFLQ